MIKSQTRPHDAQTPHNGNAQGDPLVDPLQMSGGEPAAAPAQSGVAGSGGPLPHLAAIQGSFGSFDVSGVSAHTDSAAAQANETMGSAGYATGNNVAFRDSPSLHTAAHEAAHVVQQRAGVHLSDGVGRDGDAYERHADAVADKVVRGESAEELLGQMGTPGDAAAGAAAAGPVQHTFEYKGKPDLTSKREFAANSLKTIKDKAKHPHSGKLLAPFISEFEDAVSDLNGSYGENMFWRIEDLMEQIIQKRASEGEPNGRRSYKNAIINRSVRMADVDSELGAKVEDATAVIKRIDKVYKHVVSDAAKTWATSEQLEQLRLAQEALAPIREAHATRLTPAKQAHDTYMGIEDAPSNAQVDSAEQASKAFDDVDAPPDHTDALKSGMEVLLDLDTKGIRAKAKALYLAAAADDAKQLDADSTQAEGYAQAMAGKSKSDVTKDIADRVFNQHNPGKGEWLEQMGLTQPATNLWLKPNIGTIDSTKVHASLFKDQLPARACVTTPVTTLKNQLLLTGTSGFHVTLEHFGPHGGGLGQKNPHSYRGGAYRRNDYPDAPTGKKTASQMKTDLEKLRADAVSDAEAKIENHAARKGKKR